MRTIADYRQLNDALFHAGNNSGSLNEWEDLYNRLHFYVLDLKKNKEGILSYKIGIRSLDRPGKQMLGVTVVSPSPLQMKNHSGYCTFILRDTDKMAEKNPSPRDLEISNNLNYDIYRLSLAVEGKGWNATLMNNFSSLKPGNSENIPVYISHDKYCSGSARVTLTARSENGPEKSVSSVLKIKAGADKK